MLDIRIPIGLMFVIIGPILLVYGLVTQFTDRALYEVHSLGINVNLEWGLVLSAFGAMMLALAWRAGHAPKPAADSASPPGATGH